MITFDLGQTKHGRWNGGRVLGFLLLTLLLGLLVAWRADHHPRTDDAEIFANLIGIAPQVEGPIVELKVHDNQFVKKGDLLFVIDPRPISMRWRRRNPSNRSLEGEIGDEQRRIASQVERGLCGQGRHPDSGSRCPSLGGSCGSGTCRRVQCGAGRRQSKGGMDICQQ